MSLYRKHRPQQFSSIVGQDHIKTTLANALKNGTFSHAYIFAGPKGSGKTTTARLLAKALNCTGRDMKDTIEPCGKCTSCVEVTAGHSMDVMEIDAASNRGIDEIRELREKINFAPTAGHYKVYVIDECHMLTKEAFNALLKTLEEPPAHAVFILATTELHKVPATILSRAQLFDFKKATVEEILGLLKDVAAKEKIKIEPEALGLIARLAYGAYRDALTLLDQIASIQTEGGITFSQVQAVLGQATEESVWEIVAALSKKDRSASLEIINQVYSEGKDLANFTSGVIDLLRKVVLTQAGLTKHFEASREEIGKIEKFALSFESSDLISLVTKLAEVLPKLKSSVLGQLPLEMVVFEVTNPDQNQNVKIKVQNDNGKIKIDEIVTTSKPKEKIESKVESTESIEAIVEEKKVVELEVPVVRMAEGEVVDKWPEIVKIVKKENNVVAAMLRDAVIQSEEDGVLSLGVANIFNAKQLCSVNIRPVIEKAIFETCGRNVRLECVVDKAIKSEKPAEHEEELLADAKDIFA